MICGLAERDLLAGNRMGHPVMRHVPERIALKLGLIILIGLAAAPGLLPATGLLAADPPKPAKKDSRLAIKPTTAELTTSVSPAQAKAGETVTFQVIAKLDPGYHIYKQSKKQESGPINTTFDFFDTAGLKIEGDWTASKPPERHKDPNFADVEFVEYYEDEVTWSIKLRVPAGMEAGKKALRCQAGYMVCDAKHCSIPGQWTLPDAVLTITAGEAQLAPARANRQLKLRRAHGPQDPTRRLRRSLHLHCRIRVGREFKAKSPRKPSGA